MQDSDFEDKWLLDLESFLHEELESECLVDRSHSQVQTHPILLLSLKMDLEVCWNADGDGRVMRLDG